MATSLTRRYSTAEWFNYTAGPWERTWTTSTRDTSTRFRRTTESPRTSSKIAMEPRTQMLCTNQQLGAGWIIEHYNVYSISPLSTTEAYENQRRMDDHGVCSRYRLPLMGSYEYDTELLDGCRTASGTSGTEPLRTKEQEARSQARIVRYLRLDH